MSIKTCTGELQTKILSSMHQGEHFGTNGLRLRVMRLILNIIFGGVMTVLAY